MGIAPFLVVSGFIPGVLERTSARDSPPLGRLLGQEGAGSILGARRDGEGVGDPSPLLAGMGEGRVPVAADGPFLRREVPEPRLERHMPHHSRSLSVKAAILEKVGQVRRVQRAKQLVEKHQLSQKALQRQNRAHQRPLRGAKQHARTFVHQPCQRHCNY